MKKIIALMMALCLLLSLCPMAMAEAERPVITIARSMDALVEDINTNATTLMLEEKFNIDLQFLELPTDDASAKLAVLINSGSKLPDIINVPLPAADIASYSSKGIFLALDEWLDNKEMMGDYWNEFNGIDEATNKAIMDSMTQADGHRYSLPAFGAGPWNQSPVKMWLNTAWVEKLDLEMPTTADEFKAVLKAFVTQDPNGNGKADEIGILGGNGWPYCDFITFLMGSFAPNAASDGYFYAEDGKVKASFTEERFRDGLAYIKSLVDEGLVYPATFTQDATQATATLMNGDGVYIAGAISARSDTGIASEEFFEEYEMIAPFIGPDGLQFADCTAVGAEQKWFITKDCENPELAFKLGTVGYDPKMQMNERYGINGVNWTDDPEIAANYEGRFPGAGYEITMAILDDSMWGTVQNYNWHQGLPYVQTVDFIGQLGRSAKVDDSTLTKEKLFSKYYMMQSRDLYMAHDNPDAIGVLVYNEDETMERADILASVNSYRDENITLFVTGARDLNEWDAYVEELNAMGLERLIEIMQAAYDRMN